MSADADNHEYAVYNSIMPTNSHTIPARKTKTLLLAAGLYLLNFCFIDNTFLPGNHCQISFPLAVKKYMVRPDVYTTNVLCDTIIFKTINPTNVKEEHRESKRTVGTVRKHCRRDTA
jgi:hypothetical protein